MTGNFPTSNLILQPYNLLISFPRIGTDTVVEMFYLNGSMTTDITSNIQIQ